jgi:hypothetical protein
MADVRPPPGWKAASCWATNVSPWYQQQTEVFNFENDCMERDLIGLIFQHHCRVWTMQLSKNIPLLRRFAPLTYNQWLLLPY